MATVGHSLGYALQRKFRSTQPEENQRDNVAFLLCLMHKVNIRLGRQSGLYNAGGQLNLGLCYEKGNGVKQDKTEAIKWLRKAAEQDITGEKAKAALKRLGVK